MGARAQKRKAFLDSHPFCCFCGGGARSEEIDHIPSRTLFDNRQWPEGYEFPACVNCNRVSRDDEEIVAILSRAYPDPATDQQKLEVQRLFKALSIRRMDVLQEMKPDVRKSRNAVKKYGLRVPEGKTSLSLPFLAVDGPLVSAAVTRFIRKLYLALFYMHAGHILPHAGGIAFRWYSNIQVEKGEIPEDLAPIVANFPALKRSSKNLYDQFFYRYGLVEDRSKAMFLVFFRQSFASVGFVAMEAKDLEINELAEITGPFKHDT